MELYHERFIIAINFEIEKVDWNADNADRKDLCRFFVSKDIKPHSHITILIS